MAPTLLSPDRERLRLRLLDLDTRCAPGASPIRTATDPGFARASLRCTPMDAAWRRRTAENWWSQDYRGPLDADMRAMFPLRDRLLQFGGEMTCLPGADEDLSRILERGQFWLGEKSKLSVGRASRCHSNSAALWEANQNLERSAMHIATGYALSDDGMWRQHSWCVWEKPRSIKIVETTVRRVGYFGFVLTSEEAWDFYGANG